MGDYIGERDTRSLDYGAYGSAVYSAKRKPCTECSVGFIPCLM